MFFLILFCAIVITVLSLAAWTWPGLAEEAERAGRPAREPDAKPEPNGEIGKPLLSLEGVLVAQLVAGEITAGQYRRAVEGLAARDEDRHPMAVPPENGTADA